MPLVYKPNENLLRSRAQVLVNNVNCVGVMGKGLARSFAEAYGDDIMRDYVRLCNTKALHPGDVRFERMLAIPRARAPSWEHHVALLATKDHCRDPSKLEWIDSGLLNLRRKMNLYGHQLGDCAAGLWFGRVSMVRRASLGGEVFEWVQD